MIVAAAIKDKNGKIWTLPNPARHGNIIKLIQEQGLRSISPCVQGFIDNDGKFYNRFEAAEHAVSCDQQFLCYDPLGSGKKIRRDTPELPFTLFSEDLW